VLGAVVIACTLPLPNQAGSMFAPLAPGSKTTFLALGNPRQAARPWLSQPFTMISLKSTRFSRWTAFAKY
jgi:hypothetical protein